MARLQRKGVELHARRRSIACYSDTTCRWRPGSARTMRRCRRVGARTPPSRRRGWLSPRGCLTIAFTPRLSTQIVWFSRMMRVESLCRKSRRRSAIRAWMRATLTRAFSRFLEPFCWRARRRCALARRCSSRRKYFGLPTFSPLSRTTMSCTPRSTTDGARDGWHGLEVLLHAEADEVAPGGIPADGDGTWRGAIGHGARPAHVERGIHLGERQCRGVSVPAKRGGGVLGRLCATLSVEGGVRGAARTEIAEGAVEMAQRLLRRDAGDRIEPRRLRPALHLGQRRRGVRVADALLSLVGGIRPQTQRPIVDETRTAEGPRQHSGLCGRRVESIAVGTSSPIFAVYCIPCEAATEGERRFLPMPKDRGLRAAIPMTTTKSSAKPPKVPKPPTRPALGEAAAQPLQVIEQALPMAPETLARTLRAVADELERDPALARRVAAALDGQRDSGSAPPLLAVEGRGVRFSARTAIVARPLSPRMKTLHPRRHRRERPSHAHSCRV